MKDEEWKKVPIWPPDVFAVAATIVEISDCYSDKRYDGGNRRKPFFGSDYVSRVRKTAKEWIENGSTPPTHVSDLWRELLKYKNQHLNDTSHQWRDCAMELLAIADEASKGIGFESPKEETIFSLIFLKFWLERPQRLYDSICFLINTDVACVQPKALTSQVGCCLRSLSHHLALLPPATQVKARWLRVGSKKDSTKPLNLLIVPFPYKIDGDAFVPGAPIKDEGIDPSGNGSRSSHFEVKQTWLKQNVSSKQLIGFFKNLIKAASKDVGAIQGIVLPELALDAVKARQVAKGLQGLGLEIFISGVLKAEENGNIKNQAHTSVYLDEKIFEFNQSKHHRWKLDEHQIRRYHLGHALNPQNKWWENIDVGERAVHFVEFRKGAALTVLICEDLARVDPVQPVVRSVGPNLVIALLQDGPQKEARWAGRYATGLADDPGAAVLTLTSLGMVERTMFPADTSSPRVVALWKDSKVGAKELVLKPNVHGLVLNVVCHEEEIWTLDGRSSLRNTQALSLGGVYPVSLKHPPKWIK